MFYYLCKNKHCYDKLVAEIDQMDKNGELSDPITYGEASRMEYLQACMKEAMRIHPAVGQLLERIIPEGGAILGDVWLPGGTIVGINPWVVGREKSVYGDDVDEFRPERWLDTDPETAKAMLRNFLAVSFRYISWICANQHCSSLDREGAHVWAKIILFLR